MRLEGRGIGKRFGRTVALDDVSFVLEPGRVHALVGENGAGKSTLLKIMGGAIARDSGSLQLDARPYAPRSALAARALGVALIFQELTISPTLSVAENVHIDRLAHHRNRFGLLSRRRLNEATRLLLERLELDLDPDLPAGELDPGQMKCVEICRALAVEPEVVLLDESTAFLNHAEARSVIRAMGNLREQGLAVAFVSHHLDEVFEVADELTVLKDGAFVAHHERDAITESELHAEMVGRDLAGELYPTRRTRSSEEIVLSVNAARIGPDTEPFDLAVHAGEVLGIAGLKRAGGDQLVEALAGDRALAGGRLALRGRPLESRSPADAWARGVAYLPGDRTGQGLIPAFSVSDNVTLASRPGGAFGLTDRAEARRQTMSTIAELHIRTESPDTPVESLSGGNMQKVLLGKCLVTRPDLLVLNNPTRGVDLGARQEIYRTLRRLADEGRAIVLLGEDLLELLGLCERIAVFRAGELVALHGNDGTLTESELVADML